MKFERIQNINVVTDIGNLFFQWSLIFWFRSTKLFLIVGGVASIAQFVRVVDVMLMKLISYCVIFVTSVSILTVWHLPYEKYQLEGGNVNGKLFLCFNYRSIKCRFFLIGLVIFPFHFAKKREIYVIFYWNGLSPAPLWLNFHFNWSLAFQVLSLTSYFSNKW